MVFPVSSRRGNKEVFVEKCHVNGTGRLVDVTNSVLPWIYIKQIWFRSTNCYPEMHSLYSFYVGPDLQFKQSTKQYLANPPCQLIWICNCCWQTNKLNFFGAIDNLDTNLAIQSTIRNKTIQLEMCKRRTGKVSLQFPPKLYHEIYHSSSVLHLKLLHQHRIAHFQMRLSQHCMRPKNIHQQEPPLFIWIK